MPEKQAKTLTGLHDLDSLIANLADDAFVIIASRPAMGKSALALEIARHLMKEKTKRTMIVSYEMSTIQIMHRLWKANDLFIPWDHNVLINDEPVLSVSDIQTMCEGIDNLGIVIIDYLELISYDRKLPGEYSRTAEISKICFELKAMAQKLRVPIICTSQLPRSVEYRIDKHPKLSDFSHIPIIESLADQVLFLYKDSYYNPDVVRPEITECTVAKNMYGNLGTVKLCWDSDRISFSELGVIAEETKIADFIEEI